MFSSLRARLWFSYAILILAALFVVAAVLVLYRFRNPISYRQEVDRLKAVGTIVAAQGIGQFGVDLPGRLDNASRAFNVRLVQYSQDRRVLVDTESNQQAALPFPREIAIL